MSMEIDNNGIANAGWSPWNPENEESLCQRLLKEAMDHRKFDINIGLYLVHGCWNQQIARQKDTTVQALLGKLASPSIPKNSEYIKGRLEIEFEAEGDIEACLDSKLPCPPQDLPAVLFYIHKTSMKAPVFQYLSSLSAKQIGSYFKGGSLDFLHAVHQELNENLQKYGVPPTIPRPLSSDNADGSGALRLFIAGDRMSVGKTSVCLGILGNLVALGYPVESLAYIKPATQNESPQLVQKYCERMGIDCVPIGPIVYYRGFTRAFLAGETESSAELLAKVEVKVDEVAKGKKIVIVDGVGFPAVGSICGTDNASVARASGPLDPLSGKRIPAPALVVGGSGVGGAVDAYNLNATYLEGAKVPVIGALFNKLNLEGFYSLENCKQQISLYFATNGHQQRHGRKAFGFVPLHDSLATSNPLEHVDEYIKVFGEHADISGIIQAAQAKVNEYFTTDASSRVASNEESNTTHASKRQKLVNGQSASRTRAEIEKAAISAGAAPSA
ncbi:unnamed protein product [Cylindrotheca closterium]|uniref:Uncharacterized protein n=1 Tax=Cylindrotheca closterium TaxID=2856 RepID=A0AAD2GAQ8_9STRA|nr:unnamed protein product [Cylindrotheca closterium]